MTTINSIRVNALRRIHAVETVGRGLRTPPALEPAAGSGDPALQPIRRDITEGQDGSTAWIRLSRIRAVEVERAVPGALVREQAGPSAREKEKD